MRLLRLLLVACLRRRCGNVGQARWLGRIGRSGSGAFSTVSAATGALPVDTVYAAAAVEAVAAEGVASATVTRSVLEAVVDAAVDADFEADPDADAKGTADGVDTPSVLTVARCTDTILAAAMGVGADGAGAPCAGAAGAKAGAAHVCCLSAELANGNKEGKGLLAGAPKSCTESFTLRPDDRARRAGRIRSCVTEKSPIIEWCWRYGLAKSASRDRSSLTVCAQSR